MEEFLSQKICLFYFYSSLEISSKIRKEKGNCNEKRASKMFLWFYNAFLMPLKKDFYNNLLTMYRIIPKTVLFTLICSVLTTETHN